MSAADSEDMPRVIMRLRAVEALLRDVVAELTCKTEAISELQHRVKYLEAWRDARSAMDDQVLSHIREDHSAHATMLELVCWVCCPYLIPDEIRAALSTADTREF